jgi:hypothetical protein
MPASTRTAPAKSAAPLRLTVALSAALLCLLLGAPAAPAALAGSPATVTVRVLGQASNYEALTSLEQVTTTTTPVTKDGGSCSGTSAAGALELATGGDWEGTWSTKYDDYEVTSIDKLSFPFEESSPANYYWSFWLNDTYEEVGICEAELEAGDQVLFVPSCYGASCPPEATHLLGIEAPATAEVDKPVTVTVRAYPAAGGTPSTVAGAIVDGGGTSAETNAEGHATLTFSDDGSYTLRAIGSAEEEPRSLPAEASICTHSGADGTCGTSLPSGSSSIVPPATGLPQTPPYTGPYALVAGATGITEGHVYSRKDAPRVLAGKVSSQGGSVTSISLRLRRSYHGRCWAYDGSRARLQRAACGHGSFFKIASGGDSFSYLLPSRLPPGRYVLDIEATDSAGSRTALDRGSSRIVFYVK